MQRRRNIYSGFDKKAAKRVRDAAKKREKRANMTTEEKAAANAKDASRKQDKRDALSVEEKAAANAKDASRMQDKRDAFSVEERIMENEKNKERMRIKRQNPFYRLREAKQRKYANLVCWQKERHSSEDWRLDDPLERLIRDIEERTWMICRQIVARDHTKSFTSAHIDEIANAIYDATVYDKEDWDPDTLRIMKGPIMKSQEWYSILNENFRLSNPFLRLRASLARKCIKDKFQLSQEARRDKLELICNETFIKTYKLCLQVGLDIFFNGLGRRMASAIYDSMVNDRENWQQPTLDMFAGQYLDPKNNFQMEKPVATHNPFIRLIRNMQGKHNDAFATFYAENNNYSRWSQNYGYWGRYKSDVKNERREYTNGGSYHKNDDRRRTQKIDDEIGTKLRKILLGIQSKHQFKTFSEENFANYRVSLRTALFDVYDNTIDYLQGPIFNSKEYDDLEPEEEIAPLPEYNTDDSGDESSDENSSMDSDDYSETEYFERKADEYMANLAIDDNEETTSVDKSKTKKKEVSQNKLNLLMQLNGLGLDNVDPINFKQHMKEAKDECCCYQCNQNYSDCESCDSE